MQKKPMDRKLVTISKFLAKHLRHAPAALGLTLQPGGWVAVDDLLAASASAGFPISYDALIECVQTNDKQRRAGQGVKRIAALVEKDHAWAMGFWEAVGYRVDERIVRRVRTI